MRITIAINNVNHERQIPISWDQVTFRTFLKLNDTGSDVIKAIAIITDIPYETLLKAKILNLEKVIAVLGFLNSPAQPTVPESICGYPIPKNLEFEEVQMYVDLKNYIQETKDLTPIEQLAKYPVYCAVYAVKHWKGYYDWKEAEKISDVFMDAPCTEVVGIGNFTLLKLIGLNLSIDPDSRKQSSQWKKFRLVLKDWRKILVHIQHFFTSKKRQSTPVTSG